MDFSDEEKLLIFKSVEANIRQTKIISTLKKLIKIYDVFEEELIDKCVYKNKKTGECTFHPFCEECDGICNFFEMS